MKRETGIVKSKSGFFEKICVNHWGKGERDGTRPKPAKGNCSTRRFLRKPGTTTFQRATRGNFGLDSPKSGDRGNGMGGKLGNSERAASKDKRKNIQKKEGGGPQKSAARARLLGLTSRKGGGRGGPRKQENKQTDDTGGIGGLSGEIRIPETWGGELAKSCSKVGGGAGVGNIKTWCKRWRVGPGKETSRGQRNRLVGPKGKK